MLFPTVADDYQQVVWNGRGALPWQRENDHAWFQRHGPMVSSKGTHLFTEEETARMRRNTPRLPMAWNRDTRQSPRRRAATPSSSV
jgi:hypothetical protein